MKDLLLRLLWLLDHGRRQYLSVVGTIEVVEGKITVKLPARGFIVLRHLPQG